MAPLNNQLPRLLYLDSARGFAAFSVMMWHFLVMFFPLAAPQLIHSPLHFFYYGEADIVFFFIHSGFILSYSYDFKLKSPYIASYFLFLIERFFRIYPLFFLILLISWLTQQMWHEGSSSQLTPHANSLWGVHSGTTDFLQQSLLVVRPDTQEERRLIPQDWTLTVELIAGAFLPLLIYSLRKGFLIFLLVALCFWKGANTYVFEFSIGLVLYSYRCFIQKKWAITPIAVKWMIAILAVLLYTCIFHFGSLFSDYNIAFSKAKDRLLVNMGCVLAFIVLICSGTLQRRMSAPIFVRLGQICYSLYLWHLLWLMLFASPLMGFFQQQLGFSFLMSVCVIFLCYLFSCIVLSLLSFRYVEKPYNLLGKKIGYALKSRLNEGHGTPRNL